jgi:hypothetical protein
MRALRRTLNGLAASVAALALFGTGSAFASSISLSGGVLNYTAAPAEANHVTFTYDMFHGFVIQDTGVTSITVPRMKACNSASAQTVYCMWGSFASIDAHLGNGGSFAQSKLGLTPVALFAGSGDDTLIGGGGADTLTAGAGHDTLTAGTGNTRLVGGSGTTTMTGGTGHNVYVGGSGADTITSRNGVAEDVTCADGADAVAADTADTASADCETVDRGVADIVPPAGTDPTTGTLGVAPIAAPVPAISAKPVALSTANRVPVEVACPASARTGCVGTIALSLADSDSSVGAARRAKRRMVSKAKRFRIKAGHKAVVPVTLSRRGGRTVRRSLRARGSLKLAVTVTLRTEAGTKTSTKKISIHAARRTGSKPKAGKKKRR